MPVVNVGSRHHPLACKMALSTSSRHAHKRKVGMEKQHAKWQYLQAAIMRKKGTLGKAWAFPP
eukprot:scaffold314127_cov14-Tisochrysis_lutea.AAC.1